MDKKRNAPRLRFPGFTDDWEQRKLSEVCKRITDGSHFSPAEVEDGYPMPSVKDMTENGFNYTSCKKISKDDYDVLVNQGCKPEIGDVLVAKDGSILKYAFVIKENQEVVILSSIAILKPDCQYIDGGYLAQYFKIDSFKKRVIDENTTGTGVPRIVLANFKNFEICFPNIEEQQRIGQFLDELDNLITLHQRKCDKLIEYKKGMLQKMFPQNGASVPEIRFQGFTGDWEQRKLSELATMHARIGWQNLRTSEYLDEGEYMLITGTDFEDGRINFSTCHYVEKERYDQDKHIQISDGSILITKDGTLGKVAYVQGLKKPATLNAGVFNIEVKDENEVEGKYLFQYLKAPFLMNYVGQKATGGTIKHLNQNILVDFPVIMPKRNEQEKIGQFFEGIDNLIFLQQRKLEKIKNYRNGLLQHMFV